MALVYFILFFYIIYVAIFIIIILTTKKIYKKTQSFLLAFAFICSILIVGFWKLLYGYSMYYYYKEINIWPKQKVLKTVYNVKENITCELRNEYFLYENNSSVAQKIFIDLYKSNQNQLYSDSYHGVYCHYYNRNTKEYGYKGMHDKLVDYLIINSTEEIGILVKTSKEVYNLKNNKLIGIERKLAVQNIKYLPFLNFFPGAYWGYTNETKYPVSLEKLIFKTLPK